MLSQIEQQTTSTTTLVNDGRKLKVSFTSFIPSIVELHNGHTSFWVSWGTSDETEEFQWDEYVFDRYCRDEYYIRVGDEVSAERCKTIAEIVNYYASEGWPVHIDGNDVRWLDVRFVREVLEEAMHCDDPDARDLLGVLNSRGA